MKVLHVSRHGVNAIPVPLTFCLPIGRDVDCSDIPENKKPVRVTGKDDHRLDRDKDGWGYELKEGDRQ
ncbi:hypothetical protein IQ225_17410 [Synechocystis salina LEGE 06155]|nr:hypothetical protein [Synechocystis salina LEGE 06155]